MKKEKEPHPREKLAFLCILVAWYYVPGRDQESVELLMLAAITILAKREQEALDLLMEASGHTPGEFQWRTGSGPHESSADGICMLDGYARETPGLGLEVVGSLGDLLAVLFRENQVSIAKWTLLPNTAVEPAVVRFLMLYIEAEYPEFLPVFQDLVETIRVYQTETA